MDGDLQNPPEELTKLLAKRDEGYEIVYGVRTQRKDPLHRVVASRLMMWCHEERPGIELPEDVTTFRVIEGNTARLIASLPEKKKFFSALAVWTRRPLDQRRRSGTRPARTASRSTASGSSSTTRST